MRGNADFGVFEAEDIVIAANYKNDDEAIPILVTNELQYLKSKYITDYHEPQHNTAFNLNLGNILEPSL